LGEPAVAVLAALAAVASATLLARALETPSAQALA
jgi:hypothetical protein